MRTVLVLPSMKISGGTREAVRLVAELEREGHAASIASMWASPHPMNTSLVVEDLSAWPARASRAPLQLPLIMARFARKWRKRRRTDRFMFTHYSTLPLALLVPRKSRYFFVQGLEWNFVGGGLPSQVLRSFIRSIYRSGQVISANAYLTSELTKEGVDVALEAPIWADREFMGPDAPRLDIDFAMVLRKGGIKRLDLYLHFIDLARGHGFQVGVITPEDEIATEVRPNVTEVLLRPTIAEMRLLYARSKCSIHLSDHEGFGLPPLEAMGSGCIPICRDSKGVRAFMCDSPFEANLLPLNMSIEQVFHEAAAIVSRAGGDPSQRAEARSVFEAGLRRCADARTRLASIVMDGTPQ